MKDTAGGNKARGVTKARKGGRLYAGLMATCGAEKASQHALRFLHLVEKDRENERQ
jgi:hypothetical protein